MEYKTNPVKAIREKCLDEVWVDVVGYEGKYQVSNMGRVKSMHGLWLNEREDMKS